MSEMGHKPTLEGPIVTSALPPTADITGRERDVG